MYPDPDDLTHKFGVTKAMIWNSLAAHKRGGLFKTRIIRHPNRHGRVDRMTVWSKA